MICKLTMSTCMDAISNAQMCVKYNVTYHISPKVESEDKSSDDSDTE